MSRRILKVEWIDPCSTVGWRPIDEPEYSPANCVSVGIEMLRTRRGIVLCLSLSSAGQHADPISIPRKAIRHITVLGKLVGWERE